MVQEDWQQGTHLAGVRGHVRIRKIEVQVFDLRECAAALREPRTVIAVVVVAEVEHARRTL